jgi:hypothetical protein
VPFLLGTARISGELRARSPLPGTRFLEAGAPESLGFFRRLNAGNALSYGGMGMPAWVQLDCCTLPSVMAGFALERRAVPAALEARLREVEEERFGEPASRADDDLVPVSEFCALPSARAGTVVGVSLFTLLTGLGLATRSKALGLLCLGASVLVGVAQRGSAGERVHRRFGALRVLLDRPAPHPEAERTYVYEVRLPPPEALRRMAEGASPADTLAP